MWSNTGILFLTPHLNKLIIILYKGRRYEKIGHIMTRRDSSDIPRRDSRVMIGVGVDHSWAVRGHDRISGGHEGRRWSVARHGSPAVCQRLLLS